MQAEIEPISDQGLVPPRPNLGPEPWPGEPGREWLVGLAILALLGLILLISRRRRARRRRSARSGPGRDSPEVAGLDLSPRARLIASAEAVRSAIVDARGPGWASKTTEELAIEPTLRERLGDERAGHLVELFQISDRAKFAGEEPEGVEAWETWARQFLEGWSAGATSNSKGK